MNKDYTHITFVLDRSGSMQDCWSDTAGGITSFIADQKTDKNKCTLSFYNFDDKVEENFHLVDMQSIPEKFEDFGIAPRGWTALYDAIGRAISETGTALANMPEGERPGRVLFVVQTDGLENSSNEYNASQIADLIKKQTEVYAWQFQFIGADQAAVLEATTRLGFSATTSVYYDKSNSLDTFSLASAKMKSARSLSYEAYSNNDVLAYTTQEKTALAEAKV
jgi:hypothetical protein